MVAVERVTRIELVPEAWEAAVLPLNYTRVRLQFYRHPCNGRARLRTHHRQNVRRRRKQHVITNVCPRSVGRL